MHRTVKYALGVLLVLAGMGIWVSGTKLFLPFKAYLPALSPGERPASWREYGIWDEKVDPLLFACPRCGTYVKLFRAPAEDPLCTKCRVPLHSVNWRHKPAVYGIGVFLFGALFAGMGILRLLGKPFWWANP